MGLEAKIRQEAEQPAPWGCICQTTYSTRLTAPPHSFSRSITRKVCPHYHASAQPLSTDSASARGVSWAYLISNVPGTSTLCSLAVSSSPKHVIALRCIIYSGSEHSYTQYHTVLDWKASSSDWNCHQQRCRKYFPPLAAGPPWRRNWERELLDGIECHSDPSVTPGV